MGLCQAPELTLAVGRLRDLILFGTGTFQFSIRAGHLYKPDRGRWIYRHTPAVCCENVPMILLGAMLTRGANAATLAKLSATLRRQAADVPQQT
jgi:hypothetical protein